MSEPPNERELENLATVAREEAGARFSTDTRPVDADLYCGKCGYNVRALPRNGLCPECGGLISAALRGNLLMYADATWVGRLRVGMTLLMWWPAVCTTPYLLAILSRYVWPWVLPASVLLAAGMYVVAAWFLTMPEPRELGVARRGWVARIVCRGLALLVVAAAVGSAWAAAIDKVPLDQAMVASGVCAAAAMMGLMMHLRNFATRLPDRALPGLLMFGFCGSAVAVVVVAGPAVLEVILAAIPGRPMHGHAPGLMIESAICAGFAALPLLVGFLLVALWRINAGVARAAMLAKVYAKYPDARAK